jgi:SAM-dependent methyltransferase
MSVAVKKIAGAAGIGLSITCPRCRAVLAFHRQENLWRCRACKFSARGWPAYADLGEEAQAGTAAHYSLQWGDAFGFEQFLEQNPRARAAMPLAQLGWDRLLEEIRSAALARTVRVFDAGCGFGDIPRRLLGGERTGQLSYVGADIHHALAGLPDRIAGFGSHGVFLRWDICRPVPIAEPFDYVLCRAALHHTPDPRKTFAVLCGALKPGGVIALSVYRKKGVCREAVDDALRARIAPLPPEEAFEVCRQLTALGKALAQVQETCELPEDLPLLGIRKGTWKVQELIYSALVKCFYNEEFGDTFSTLVNYDWYHAPNAHRLERAEVEDWFAEQGIEVRDRTSIEAQHYMAGVRRA